jgi:choline kinase
MRITRAVILAAGHGNRLRAFTADRPRPLLEVGGRALIDRQLEALGGCGVRDVTVVAGYREEQLREHVGQRARIVLNGHYHETGSLYSLWLAAEHLKGGAFVLNGDTVFSPLLLDRLKWHPAPDALLFDSGRTLEAREMKVRVAGRYVVDMSRQMPPRLASGEHLGVLKFGEEGALRLQEVLDRLVRAGEAGERVTRAVVELAHRWPIVAVEADGLPWIEIRCADDLAYANRVVAPAIDLSLTHGARRR